MLCYSLRHALFGFNSDELRVTPGVFVYLLNVCKFVLWQARNDHGHRFRDVRPGAASVIIKVKTRVKFTLPLFFKTVQVRPSVDSAISIVNGVPVVSLLLYLLVGCL